MKLAFTGKGGVGKTTTVVLTAELLRRGKKPVFIVDADPDMNVGTLLGFSGDLPIRPISEMKELIHERTGVKENEPAPFFKMNPRVDDIPEKYSLDVNGIKLLIMGTIQKGGGGCACPENAFLKSLLSYLMIARDEWVLLDMEAGIEHLGRGTAIGVDRMVVVVEPNKTSLETAIRIKKLSRDLGVKNLVAMGNKITSDDEKEYIIQNLKDIEVTGYIKYSEEIKNLSLGKIKPWDLSDEIIGSIGGLIESLTAV